MTKIDRQKFIDAMVGMRTDGEHAREWITEAADMILAAVQTATQDETRTHALDLATVLHKDTFRVRIDPEQDITGEVLATAERFHAWLAGDGSTAPAVPFSKKPE